MVSWMLEADIVSLFGSKETTVAEEEFNETADKHLNPEHPKIFSHLEEVEKEFL